MHVIIYHAILELKYNDVYAYTCGIRVPVSTMAPRNSHIVQLLLCCDL
jgi:hypothetical protein